MTKRVTADSDRDAVNLNRGARRKLTDSDHDSFREEMRLATAKQLGIDPERIRYGPLEGGKPGV